MTNGRDPLIYEDDSVNHLGLSDKITATVTAEFLRIGRRTPWGRV
jgi:hypothetical protein